MMQTMEGEFARAGVLKSPVRTGPIVADAIIAADAAAWQPYDAKRA